MLHPFLLVTTNSWQRPFSFLSPRWPLWRDSTLLLFIVIIIHLPSKMDLLITIAQPEGGDLPTGKSHRLWSYQHFIRIRHNLLCRHRSSYAPLSSFTNANINKGRPCLYLVFNNALATSHIKMNESMKVSVKEYLALKKQINKMNVNLVWQRNLQDIKYVYNVKFISTYQHMSH